MPMYARVSHVAPRFTRQPLNTAVRRRSLCVRCGRRGKRCRDEQRRRREAAWARGAPGGERRAGVDVRRAGPEPEPVPRYGCQGARRPHEQGQR